MLQHIINVCQHLTDLLQKLKRSIHFLSRHSACMHRILIPSTPGGVQIIVVKVFVCLITCISQKPHVLTSLNFLYVTYGHGLVILWQQCSSLCTSGFVDDVMYSHKFPMYSPEGAILFDFVITYNSSKLHIYSKM